MNAYEYLTLPECVLEISADEESITAVRRVETAGTAAPNALTRRAVGAIADYLAGGELAQLPLAPQGTEFERMVWQTLQQIPYGQTRYYQQIAISIGRPNAVRAVGRAIGKNPILLFIPCHRVIGKDGSLTGFAAGLEMKSRLLKLEHGKEK